MPQCPVTSKVPDCPGLDVSQQGEARVAVGLTNLAKVRALPSKPSQQKSIRLRSSARLFCRGWATCMFCAVNIARSQELPLGET